MSDLLLQIDELKTYFEVDAGTVKAVDGVSFSLNRGETIGIVGESGCGKTVTAQSILQIMPHPGKIVGGDIYFYPEAENTPLNIAQYGANSRTMRSIRGNEIAFVFQEPMTALSPVHTIGNQIIESLLVHNKGMSTRQARDQTIELLAGVGMPNPTDKIDAYTFQLSGGMRQRAMIAMALACDPRLLIADEPTTAVDVTIQAKILELINEIKRKYKMSILMITHDLAVVADVADKIVVMYLGKEVEKGSVIDVYDNPVHPYTEALLNTIPKPGKNSKKLLNTIEGTVPDPYSIPPGCAFEPRCEKSIKGLCDCKQPPLVKLESGQEVRCFLYSQERGRRVAGD